jgi:hypothetical protein
VAIGVGNQVNTAELQGIADRTQDVFQVTDYNSLPTITHNLLQRACQRELSPLYFIECLTFTIDHAFVVWRFCLRLRNSIFNQSIKETLPALVAWFVYIFK